MRNHRLGELSGEYNFGAAMSRLGPIFNKWLDDLFPGTRNKSKVVRERIIYRSAEDTAKLKRPLSKGDAMEIDHDDFHISVDNLNELGMDIE